MRNLLQTNPPSIVGLEIGTSKVCVAVGERNPDGTLHILGVGEAPSRGVRKGEIVDFDSAQKSVQEAVNDAEKSSGVIIANLRLAFKSEHISSFYHRCSIDLGGREIREADIEQLQSQARDVSIPTQDAIIQSIPQHYYVDERQGIFNPVGQNGRQFTVDFYIIQVARSRIQNAIRCVQELKIKVEDIIFSPFAAAQAVLNQNQKNHGALLIDMGEGTMDYIVYMNGVVKQTGVAAVGGDHINNDISKGLRIPLAQSEKLKIEEGSALLDRNLSGKTIYLKKEFGFPGREIELKTLNEIIHMRVRETLTALRKRISAEQDLKSLNAGIFLTGGTSLLKGIGQLAEEIFEMPVNLTEDPGHSTAIGLLINP